MTSILRQTSYSNPLIVATMTADIETIDLSMDDDTVPQRQHQVEADEDYLNDLLGSSQRAKKRKEKAARRNADDGYRRELTQVMSPPSSLKFRRPDMGFQKTNRVAPRHAQYTDPYPPSTSASKVRGRTKLPSITLHSDCSSDSMDETPPSSRAWEKLPPQKRSKRGIDSNDTTTYEIPLSGDDRSLFLTPEPVRAPRSSSTLKRPWTDSQTEAATTSPYFTNQTPSKSNKRNPGSFGSQARKIAGGNGYAPSPSVSSSQIDEAHAGLIATINSAQSSLEMMQSQLLQPMVELAKRVNVLEEQNKALVALLKENGLVSKGKHFATPPKEDGGEIPRTPLAKPARSAPMAGMEYGGPLYAGSQTKGSGCFTDILKKHKQGSGATSAAASSPTAHSISPEARRAKREEYLAQERERSAREARDGPAAQDARDKRAAGDDLA
jgi:hypothetical protein